MSFTVPSYMHLDAKSRGYAYFGMNPPVGVASYGGGETKMCQVEIHNGRTHEEPLKLDETSFELIDCPTELSTEDFYKIGQGDEELTQKYHDEVIKLVKAKLGCDKIICFHNVVRNAKREGESGSNIQGYAIGGPHTDSSCLSGDELALGSLLPQQKGSKGNDNDNDDDKASNYKRYLYLNLWRNISEDPIEDFPLAMMDERTAVKPDDYLPRDLYMPGDLHLVQYGLNARHADQHKWYYFPKMTKTEGILFKQIDSDWTKSGRTCFHMAVKDPNAKSDAKPRESIELRMICYFKEASVDSMPTKENTATGLGTDTMTKPSSLHTASTFQLLGALITKIPIIGSLLGSILSSPLVKMMIDMKTPKQHPPYSGNPEDYMDRIMGSVTAFAVWPSVAKWGILKQLKGKSETEAIRELTEILVKDSTGYNEMKNFSAEDKKAIVKTLLANDKYVAAVRDNVLCKIEQ